MKSSHPNKQIPSKCHNRSEVYKLYNFTEVRGSFPQKPEKKLEAVGSRRASSKAEISSPEAAAAM